MKEIVSQVAVHDEQLDEKKVKLVSFISFLSGFSQAVLIYIMSYYFKLATGTENIGLFYAVSYLIVLAILLNFHKVIRKLGKSQVLYFSVLAKIIVLCVLLFLEPSFLAIALLVAYIITDTLERTSIDIILESFSSDKMSGRIRGLHLTIFNLGFIFGPFISTRVLGGLGFQGVFIFVLVLNILVLLLSLSGLRGVNHKFEQKLGVVDVFKKVFARKDILKIYYISFVLEFFFALMIIYAPLYLLDRGFSWDQIGIVFTIMLVPFVILQYPVGILADKKLGEKELIIFSLVIMAISTGAVFFTQTSSVIIWGLILFSTRIGAALIELLRDSYFYKKIDGHDVDLINFFRTAMPFSYVFSTGIAALLFLFFDIKSIFILIIAVILTAFYPALKLMDNPIEKELNV